MTRDIQEGFEDILDKIIYAPSLQRFYEKHQRSGEAFMNMTPILVKIMEKIFHYKVKDYDIYYIALSHLDACWKWGVNDSKVRAYKTFYKAIEHIKKYPYFSISLTSPQYYNWIKKYDKNLWEETKEMVMKDKIDACGGSWIEPDLLMPSAEALVRQRMYGQHYYLRNFGKISKVETVLDVFGYPNSLPQILKKSGAEAFWTSKLTWNDYTLFPFANFNWRGPDGTEIFTHMFKFNIMALIDLGLYKVTSRRPLKPGLVFNSSNLEDCEYITPLNIMGTRIGKPDFSTLNELKGKISDKDYVKSLGIFYGLGDGGKGPLEIEIGLFENISRKFNHKHTNTHNYFRLLRKDVGENIVTWDDELYLEYHRGCLTTQVRVKQGNRFAENKTIICEILSTQALVSSILPDFEYPNKKIWDSWQKIMFNQFHDILPGSSIPEVYVLTYKEHEAAIKNMDDCVDATLIEILSRIPDSSEKILVYNPIPIEQDLFIPIDDKDLYLGKIESSSMISFKMSDINKIKENLKSSLEMAESKSAIILQNSKIRCLISKQNGNLIGLCKNEGINLLYGERNGFDDFKIPLLSDIDKIPDKMLKIKGARLKIYREKFGKNPYPAWNISANYTQNPINLKFKDCSIISNGSDKIKIKSTYEFGNSKCEIDYSLKNESDILDVNLLIKLKDPEHFIKYFVPLNLKSIEVVADTQFATVTRKRVPRTKMEAGKWEFSMQRWMDVSDEDYGLSIFNACRYGASANAKGIAVSLVRSPISVKDPFYSYEKQFEYKSEKPKYSDLEVHEFRLAIYPHSSSWDNAETQQKALAFNNLPIIIDSPQDIKNDSTIKVIQHSALKNNGIKLDYEEVPIASVRATSKNIIITAVKAGEWMNLNEDVLENGKIGYKDNTGILPEEITDWSWDKRTIILRAHECNGKKTNAKIELINVEYSNKIEKIEEVDLLEWNKYNDVKFTILEGNIVSIEANFGKYEIKTYRITMK